MATRRQRVEVAVFLLVCAGIMGGLLYLVAGLNDSGVEYSVVFDESISGLYEGAFVQYLGVPVGKVKRRVSHTLRTTSTGQGA